MKIQPWCKGKVKGSRECVKISKVKSKNGFLLHVISWVEIRGHRTTFSPRDENILLFS